MGLEGLGVGGFSFDGAFDVGLHVVEAGDEFMDGGDELVELADEGDDCKQGTRKATDFDEGHGSTPFYEYSPYKARKIVDKKEPYERDT
ncbi:hypothetical protein CL176_09535 [Suicoccus acidiformans]|uniref:Uncharacterized protein n=1 Tax=Suicoccus acidiformans TaxID=2036206 RepID=A0A347WMB3_9LACT|nr:hypothetical protein CL176_09535 [Suicoccus acidiformans]